MALEETIISGKPRGTLDVLGNFVIEETFIENADGSIRYPTIEEIFVSAMELIMISDKSLTIHRNLVPHSVLNDQAKSMSCAGAVNFDKNFVRLA